MKPYQQTARAIWLVPIRIFLGYSWLSEGIIKARGDWLHTVMLAGRATEADTSASVTEAGYRMYRIITESTPVWFEWMAERIILPNAMLFQVLLVLAEILTGIMLIAGAFTFISGLLSLCLLLVLLVSAGFYETAWWYIPASICMLGGAGRALGVDSILIPYIKIQFGSSSNNRSD